MKRIMIVPKQRKNILFHAAASLTAAAAILFFQTFNVCAADDFITWRNEGKVGEKKAVGITLQLTDFEPFNESSTFQVTLSLKTKGGEAIPQEDCSFIFDSGLNSAKQDAVVQDFRFIEQGKARITVSGRKNTDKSEGILNKKTPLVLGKLAVTVRNQDVEVKPVPEECSAVNESGMLVSFTSFGNQDAYVLKAEENGTSENPGSGGNGGSSGGGGGSRRRVSGSSKSEDLLSGPGVPVETKGTWIQGANGTWLFLGEGGYYAVDTWIYVKGNWYRMGKDGIMLTGWYEENGNCYFLNPEGAMLRGWQQIDLLWYYLGNDGIMQTGWQKINEKWYYLNPVRPVPQLVFDPATGVVLTDPVTFAPITTTKGQKTYGEMYQNTVTPDGYQVDETGAWIN